MGWLMTPIYGVPRAGWLLAAGGVFWLVYKSRQQAPSDDGGNVSSIQSRRGRQYRTVSGRGRRAA